MYRLELDSVIDIHSFLGSISTSKLLEIQFKVNI
jgi:hypothetical protein